MEAPLSGTVGLPPIEVINATCQRARYECRMTWVKQPNASGARMNMVTPQWWRPATQTEQIGRELLTGPNPSRCQAQPMSRF